MQKRLGIGVVGCGRISEFHLPAIKKIKNVDLIAVADINEEGAKETAKKYDAKRYYLTATELFQDSEIDGVILCLPHHLHCSMTLEAAQHNKHILVEKPLALTVKDADRMIQSAEDKNVILMVGQVQRFFQQYTRVKDYIESGKLGQPLQVIEKRLLKVKISPTSWWKSSKKTGGLLLPLNGTHSIDFFLSLFNTLPVRVYCETQHNNLEWEGEDEFSLQMKLKNGTIVTMHHSFNSSEDINEVIIIGSDNSIRFNGIAGDFRVNGKAEIDFAPAFEAQMREFISAISEKREPIASAKDVRDTIRVLEAARISAEEHIAVSL